MPRSKMRVAFPTQRLAKMNVASRVTIQIFRDYK